MTAIVNVTLVMRDHLIEDGVLLIRDGIIQDLGERRSISIPADCTVIDGEGEYLGPGFVDIHLHAGPTGRIFHEPVKSCQHHLRNGTTTMLPALYFSMNREEMIWGMEKIREASKLPECQNIAGLYMEGPYMNPKFGSHRESNPWRNPICREDYMPVIKAGAGFVKVWSLAPEREHIEQFVQDAKAADPNVLFAVGHSEASPQQIEALMPYGLRLGTHHTNSTGDLPKYPECRGVCVDEAVNYNREIYAELICDSQGIHVDPYMLRLVRKIKGEDRFILITDATYCDAPSPPGYEHITDLFYDETGEIAGTNLTLNVACRNMMKHTGASIVDVFRYASYNPSRAVGFLDRGELRKGLRADLVICDHRMQIKNVILKGEVQL